MMLKHSFGLVAEADAVERAVGRLLDDGIRTRDLGGAAKCSEIGKAVIERL